MERLQKILAKAGVSSRRAAEEMIENGRVQINGKIVTELGTKADPERDHIRVDGKLLQGPERIRYFVLNKPKGFVTTVSDPEGRPTVMQFFTGERERLYPVGRLDYLSEGLLLVTNDGELANKLTKAASGVEKTYLVKVAGQPSEEMLDALRQGVVIERGRPGTGSGRVRTAPAKIRQVREGDNPWYEVVLIEGRNRELRKMFEEIGHHVEKIRRVGYGPLVLDQEPGKLRELEAEEVNALRLTAEGKLKPRRRRGPAPAQLPTVAGKTVRYKKADGRPGYEPRAPREDGARFGAGARPPFKRTVRPEFAENSKSESPAMPRSAFKKDSRPGSKPSFKPEFKPGFKSAPRAEFKGGAKPEYRPTGKPAFRTGAKPGVEAAGFDKPRFEKPAFRKPAFGKPGFDKPQKFAGKPRREEPPVTDYVLPPRKAGPPDTEFDEKPEGKRGAFNPDYKPGFRTGAKPAFRKDGPPKRFDGGKPFTSSRPKREVTRPVDDDFEGPVKKTPGFKIEPVTDEPRGRSSFDRPRSGRPATGGSRPDRPRSDRAGTDRPAGNRPFRPAPGAGRDAKPFRPSGRPAGAPAGRFDSNRPARTDRPSRPFTPRTDGPPTGRPKPFGAGEGRSRDDRAGEARPREFKPRTGAAPRTGAGSRPTPLGGKTGPDGAPRIKERWRNSFTGKNKGRPKPKPKAE